MPSPNTNITTLTVNNTVSDMMLKINELVYNINSSVGGSGSSYSSYPCGAIGEEVFFEYSNVVTLTKDYTISHNKNAFSYGDLVIGGNSIITVLDGSVWTIM